MLIREELNKQEAGGIVGRNSSSSVHYLDKYRSSQPKKSLDGRFMTKRSLLDLVGREPVVFNVEKRKGSSTYSSSDVGQNNIMDATYETLKLLNKNPLKGSHSNKPQQRQLYMEHQLGSPPKVKTLQSRQFNSSQRQSLSRVNPHGISLASLAKQTLNKGDESQERFKGAPNLPPAKN